MFTYTRILISIHMWPAVWIWGPRIHISIQKKIQGTKKNPDNSDAIDCSGDAIRITNRLLDLTEACSDIHGSTQLLRSSEIGTIDLERSATVDPSLRVARPQAAWETSPWISEQASVRSRSLLVMRMASPEHSIASELSGILPSWNFFFL